MRGWIGFDLDGTLAVYDGWRGADHIGEPIPAMVERLKDHLDNGDEVRIFTARVYSDGTPERDAECHQSRSCIESWCQEHVGKVLPITCVKRLWDDPHVR
jgi:hypothetical protein